MKELKRILMAVLVGAMLVAGALAQKGNNNSNRPPKEPDKVVEKPKPQPSNSNKRGRP
jgi:hypothetical protein